MSYLYIYVGSIVLAIGSRGRRGHGRILVGFTSTYANNVFTNSANADVYLIQHYVIKFVSVVWQVCCFIWELTATI
jgi:hypothetical protein